MKCEVGLLLLLKQQCWESGDLSESAVTCFECGWNASECFCCASSGMGIKTLPCRSLKALQSKNCYCQRTIEKLMPRKVKWFTYTNKRREQIQVLWIAVLFTRFRCLLDKCNSRVDYCFQGSVETLS